MSKVSTAEAASPTRAHSRTNSENARPAPTGPGPGTAGPEGAGREEEWDGRAVDAVMAEHSVGQEGPARPGIGRAGGAHCKPAACFT